MDNVIGIRTEPLPMRQPGLPVSADTTGGAANPAPRDVVSLGASEGSAAPAPAPGPVVDDLATRRQAISQKEARLQELQRLVAARRAEPAASPEGFLVAGAGTPVAESRPFLAGLGAQVMEMLGEPSGVGEAVTVEDPDARRASLAAREAEIVEREKARLAVVEERVATRLEELGRPLQVQLDAVVASLDTRGQTVAASEERVRAESKDHDARVGEKVANVAGERRVTLESNFSKKEVELRKAWEAASAQAKADATSALQALGPRYAAHHQTLESQYRDAIQADATMVNDLAAEKTRLEGYLAELKTTLEAARAEETRAGGLRQAQGGAVSGDRDRLQAQRDALRKELESQQRRLSEAKAQASRMTHEKADLEGERLRKQLGRVGTSPMQPMPGAMPGPAPMGPGMLGPDGMPIDSSGWSTWSAAPPQDTPVDDGGWAAWRGETV